MLFSRWNVNISVDVDFIPMSRKGQLTGFCNAIAKFYLKAERTYLCNPKTKYSCAVLLTGMFHICILASEVDLICLARNSHLTGFCHALSKMVKRMTCTQTRNTGTQEHRNTGTQEHRNTLEHSGTPQSTPEHRNSQKTPEHRIWRCCFVFPLQTM